MATQSEAWQAIAAIKALWGEADAGPVEVPRLLLDTIFSGDIQMTISDAGRDVAVAGPNDVLWTFSAGIDDPEVRIIAGLIEVLDQFDQPTTMRILEYLRERNR